jgi:hypothetical protein
MPRRLRRFVTWRAASIADRDLSRQDRLCLLGLGLSPQPCFLCSVGARPRECALSRVQNGEIFRDDVFETEEDRTTHDGVTDGDLVEVR